MKVLFLDIDGVLNSHRSCVAFGGFPFEVDGKDRAMFDEVALSLIRGIVEVSGASVVLSSSWRITHNWDKVGRALELPIMDRTPSLLGNRGSEIQHWLNEHPEVETYVIVDDDDDMLDIQRPHFVKTNMNDGFTWACAQKMAELFGVSIFDAGKGARERIVSKPALAWE